MGIVGYNCEQVNALRGAINDTAQRAGEGIVEKLHNEIIVPMSTAWYAPDAVDFFQRFQTVVLESGAAITEAFDAYRGFVQTAGEYWANRTGGEKPVLPAIDEVVLNLKVDDIKPDNAGNVTIDEDRAEAIAAGLGEVEADIKSDLEQLANTLNAESAFIGNNQSDALRACFATISDTIKKIFSYLTDGENNLSQQIKIEVQKYGESANEVNSAFNGNNN